MKKLIAFILIAVCAVGSAEAKYSQNCSIRYKKENGWSKYYEVTVHFLSGSELNTATKSYSYSSYSTYAVVFWGNDEATIIKISSFTSCGMEVTKSCIANQITNMEGEDKSNVDWEICTSMICI